MASITKRLDKTVEALDKNQLKKALVLTDTPKLERQHGFVVEAAETCLADKDKCDQAIREARNKVKETTTVPEDSADLEGLEEYLKPREDSMNQSEVPAGAEVEQQEPVVCEECMIAAAVGQFGEISDECDGSVRARLEKIVEDDMTPPEKWLKEMADIAENATCNQEAYVVVLSGLTEALEKNNSPILKKLEEEDVQ